MTRPSVDNVFTYGILMSDGHVAARLPGYRLDYGYHATVVEQPGSSVYGTLVTGVDERQLRRYDSIEGVDHGYYSRRVVGVNTADGDRLAWVYVMNRAALVNAKETDGSGLSEWSYRRMVAEYERVGHGPWAAEQLLTLMPEREAWTR